MAHSSRAIQQRLAQCPLFHLVPQSLLISETTRCSTEDQLEGKFWNSFRCLQTHNICSIYVSSDIGVTFAKTASLGSSTVVNKIRVHPTVAGDVWASTDVGLFHSTNYGSTFTQIGSGCTTGYDFGKPIPRSFILELPLTRSSPWFWIHEHKLPRDLRLLHG